MELKIRKLNCGERYACTPKSIKHLFKETDAFVSFGFLSRKFAFDSRDTKRANTKGAVIMSALINARDAAEQPYGSCIISFYVISDSSYDKESEQAFAASCLPALHRWYESVMGRPQTAPSGIENFIAEWDGAEFKVHCYRYA